MQIPRTTDKAMH